jgi:hypothetical protein
MPIPPPDWVAFDAHKTQGLDLLGLRAPVQQISNHLLNGLTSVTPKIRYLSVLSWIVWRYNEAKQPNDWGAFSQFAAAQEAVIVMANVLRDRSILQLVGVGKAGNLLDSGIRTLPLDPLVQNIAFNIYASSSRQLGLTFESKTGVYGLFEQRGLPLARAFDAVIGPTSYGKRLTRRPTIRQLARASVEELANVLSLDTVPQREKKLLIEAIIPANPSDAGEKRRIETFALLLWLTAINKQQISEDDLFSAAREPPRSLPAVLQNALDGWLEYTIRDVLAATHEAVFQAVLADVDAASARRGGPALAAEVVAALINAVDDHNEYLREFDLLKVGETVKNISFAQILDRVHAACRERETISNGLRRWRGGLSETDLYDSALEAGPAAAALLPVAWSLAAHRVTPLLNQPAVQPRAILETGDFRQIGLRHVIFPKLEEFIRSKRTYLEVMAELTVRTVQQHIRVAWSRMAAPNGKDVSVIVADLETWARNNRFAAGRTDSRLWVAISWLEQLGLSDEDGITVSGQRVLDGAFATLERA